MEVKNFCLLVMMLMILSVFGDNGNSVELKSEEDWVFNSSIEFNKNEEHGLGLIDYKDNDPTNDIVFNETVPMASFDWRNYDGEDWTTRIKQQGNCGSCWAFSTIAVIESVINIKNDDPDLDLDLSEQYMVSCVPESYSAYGCDGAIADPLIGPSYLDWVKIFDAIPEGKFPYSATDESCGNKATDFYKYKVEVKNYGEVDSSITSIKNALIEKGPLHATMQIFEDFLNEYPNQNIWPDDEYFHHHGDFVGGHVVVIVGFGDDYWICKNSWGTNWGLDGWFKIGFNECEIEQFVAFITCDKYIPPADATVTVELYKIKALDDLEGPFDEEDWAWQTSVDGSAKTDRWEDNHNTITKIKSLRWDTSNDIVDITFKLKEIDDWPGNDDIADIGEGHGNEPYDDDERSWADFPRCVYFEVTLDRNKDDIEDALTGDRFDPVSESGWNGYKTSGNFDGGSDDENDAEIWFMVTYKTIIPAEPDLECYGNIFPYGAVKPGAKVTGEFTVTNEGDSASLLDWEVSDWPDWGTSWSFNPSSGNDLREGAIVTVEVSFNAPDIELKSFSGYIEVVNKEDNSDYDTIPVGVTTPRKRALFFNFIELIQNQFSQFFKLINSFILFLDVS